MKRTIAALAILLFATALSAADARRYLVGTRRAAHTGALQAVRNTIEFEPSQVAPFRIFDGFAATLTEDEADELRASREVRWIEPVVARHAFIEQRNFLGQTLPYGIHAITARQAAAGRRTGTVNVVVLDTGIDYMHPELKTSYAGGYNVFNNSSDPLDDEGHGTHVAGTIAAADNTEGVIGVAPDINLWSVKVLDASGTGTSEGVLEGIDWVIAQKQALGGNWVINLSLGSNEESIGEREAFQRAADAGILVVAASGNSSTPNRPAPVAFPAAFPSVLAVGAVDENHELAYFSNQGPELVLVAPGLYILSTLPIGSDFVSFVTDGNIAYEAAPLTGSRRDTVTAEFVDCGIGKPEEFPASVQGKIALIKRGGETFANKVRAAKAAGAIAVALYNYDHKPVPSQWTLISDLASQQEDWPVVLRLTLADAEQLLKQGRRTITLSYRPDDYGYLSGTSMSAPHVTGAAALLWTLAPGATSEQIRNALIQTAIDLGAPGADPQYGHGRMNIFAAARLLAPNAFVPGPTTGRPIGRRGRG
ncbi:MAG TPA: S8 family serine peptidase [Thermoanaerobaculia bacterium]|nr:S8 family serine peptidase [Thermoanaerobaculia bacterium]